jgi:3-(3-hydroxy-phenyl)propionate hydroxylase
VWNGDVDDRELDRYDAQRRPIAVNYVQQTTMRNKAMLEETDAGARKAKHDEMRAVVADPVRAREYLLQSSMIEALKHSESLA